MSNAKSNALCIAFGVTLSLVLSLSLALAFSLSLFLLFSKAALHTQHTHKHTHTHTAVQYLFETSGIRQHASASAHVSIRAHTSASERAHGRRQHTSAHVSIGEHTPAYAHSIREHTPASEQACRRDEKVARLCSLMLLVFVLTDAPRGALLALAASCVMCSQMPNPRRVSGR